MSYTERPESNPYAAPVSDLMFDDFGQPKPFLGYSGFWRRFAALFLDNILMNIVTYPIGLGIGFAVGNAMGDTPSAQVTAFVLALVVSLAINIAYFAGMESSTSQATLGKKALGIKVGGLDGRRISFGKAVGRLLGKILSGIILYIGFIMAAFTERKQALHDIMAGTLVVKTR